MPSSRPAEDIYGGQSPVDLAAYSIPEAAHYLRLPTATVRAWTLGRRRTAGEKVRRSKALVPPADPRRALLSFRNLVELHILSALHREHRVLQRAVRRALEYVKAQFKTDHPLLTRQMPTEAMNLFVQQYSEQVHLSATGRLALERVLEAYLKRIEWDDAGLPRRLYPFSREAEEQSPQLIAIDPRVQFGRPCIAGTGIPTAILAERHEAGDSVEELAEDYERPQREIKEALAYERRIGAAEALVFFVDRCLGRGLVKTLRAAGAHAEYFDDHFPGETEDEVWMPAVGARGWAVLTRDTRIRHRPGEQQAFLAANLRLFSLQTRRGINGRTISAIFAQQLSKIVALCTSQPPPFIAGVTRAGVVIYKLPAK